MSFLRDKALTTTSPLHRIVSHVYYRNRFYREKLSRAGIGPDQIHCAEELPLLPVTEREELIGNPGILLSVPKEEVVQAHLSTGTTRRSPLYILFSWDDLYVRGLLPLVGAPGARLFEIQEGEIVFNALPYEVSVTGLALHRALQDGIGACVVPVGKGGFYADPAKTLKLMRALRGDHLVTTPSYALQLAELATRCGITAPEELGLTALWLIGEPCSDALRRHIDRLWGCPAFLYYGSLESGPIGLECPLRDGYHVASNFVDVEILPVPDLGRSDTDGLLGEIVVTVLWRQASPLLRFRTGDFGFWKPSPCRCGIPGAKLRVLGRRHDLISTADFPRFALELEEALLNLPGVSPWYRLKPEVDSLRVILPEPCEGDQASLARSVRGEIERRFRVACRVEFTKEHGYTGGKLIRVVRDGEKP